MKKVYLSGSEITDRKNLHKTLQIRFCFSEYYGGNLDALYDCLTDISEETMLVLSETEELSETLKTYYKSFMHVLKDAAKANPKFTYIVL